MANLRIGIAAALAAVAVMRATLVHAADNPQFMPLMTYVQQQDIAKDPVALGYVAIRCSSLYLVFVAMLDDETAPERQQRKAVYAQASETFQRIAFSMRMAGTTTTAESAVRDVGQSLTAISRLYQDRIRQAKDLNNNMFSDSLILGDFNGCETLRKNQ
jgi:hypothetical protein